MTPSDPGRPERHLHADHSGPGATYSSRPGAFPSRPTGPRAPTVADRRHPRVGIQDGNGDDRGENWWGANAPYPAAGPISFDLRPSSAVRGQPRRVQFASGTPTISSTTPIPATPYHDRQFPSVTMPDTSTPTSQSGTVTTRPRQLPHHGDRHLQHLHVEGPPAAIASFSGRHRQQPVSAATT